MLSQTVAAATATNAEKVAVALFSRAKAAQGERGKGLMSFLFQVIWIKNTCALDKRGQEGFANPLLCATHNNFKKIQCATVVMNPGKCSTVPSPISICVAVFQFSAIVEHSEKCNISSQFCISFFNFEVFKMGFKIWEWQSSSFEPQWQGFSSRKNLVASTYLV